MSREGDDHGTTADPAGEDPVVAVDSLTVGYGEEPVLAALSLSVESGTLVGLVGPNGAGKTTLLRTVGAGIDPDAGTVRVAGERIHDLSSKAASRLVASVPQDTGLAFDFSVRETVAMGRTPHVSRFGRVDAADRAAVEEAMARTEVAEFADRPVTAVSGGERSRVLLARALAQDTPVLLLDEPTASLDVNHQVRTLELVRAEVDAGKTAVAAIHDLNLAARYCDELVVLADGGVLAHGLPEDVLTGETVREAFDTDAVVATDPVTGAPRVTALPGRSGDETPGRVHIVAGGGNAGPLLSRLATAGYEVSVGAVPAGDRDAEVAAAFGMEAVTVPPFADVDAGARDRSAELAAAADAAVVADVDLTAGLAPVLDAAREAPAVICVEERPLADRARDEAAVDRYRRLREAGIVADDGTGVLDAIAAATEADAGAADDGLPAELLSADDD